MSAKFPSALRPTIEALGDVIHDESGMTIVSGWSLRCKEGGIGWTVPELDALCILAKQYPELSTDELVSRLDLMGLCGF